MSQRVKNIARGVDRNPIDNTFFGEGTRRVTFEGIEYVINVNEQKAFANDEVAKAVATGANLRIADNKDGDGHSRR